jgi:hypothetical protein|tara:strand:- start:33 stop:458 length:426 start_codon:yes stop_codon:yes gene_type:complete
MTKKYDGLDEAFNVETEIVSAEKESMEVAKKLKLEKNDVDKDYDYTRGNLYSIIEKGQEAINGILELAQESEMPRAYEVAGQLIKNVADATDKLMDLQKKLKDVNEESKKGPTNVTNALFVGSTSDLSKFLKSQNEDTEKK